MEPGKTEAFRKRIFSFYRENARSFPWRETTDRYRVMVSEMMLQQTQTERVTGKYADWIKRFPDVVALAEASLREVLECWSGLGYNSRGQRLHRCARTIADEYGGVVPASPGELARLPGIGAYTSRSIPIFADNLDIAAVDTNIRRILIHELGAPETASPGELLSLAETVLPRGRSREWHNALMDYGALVLTGRRTGIRPRTRQSAFKGSNRWYRGQVVRDLLGKKVMLLEELAGLYGEGIVDVLGELEREGLVERVPSPSGDDLFRIPE